MGCEAAADLTVLTDGNRCIADTCWKITTDSNGPLAIAASGQSSHLKDTVFQMNEGVRTTLSIKR